MRGRFITFDGIEGCGKSTHARLLYEHLKKAGKKIILVHEPGGTGAGERIRKIFLKKEKGVDLCVESELFLIEASRSQLIREVINPALKKGTSVICDRFNHSTYAYQAYGGGLSKKAVRDVERYSIGNLRPDITFILDVPVKLGLSRIKKPDRMESKSAAFHQRVRSGFLDMAGRNKKKINVIDASRSIDNVNKDIRRLTENVF
jgi:dTMP kinase